MKTKQEIVQNWLPRYTGQPLDKFGEYILLTNFDNYVSLFASWHNVPINGLDRAMRSATAGGITIIAAVPCGQSIGLRRKIASSLTSDCIAHRGGYVRFADIDDLQIDKAKGVDGEDEDYSVIYSVAGDGQKFEFSCGWGEIKVAAGSVRIALD